MTVFLAFALKYWQEIAVGVLLALAIGWYNWHVDRLLSEREQQVTMNLNKTWVDHEHQAIAAEQAKAATKEKDQAANFAALQSDYTKEHDRANKADTARAAAVRLRLTSPICPSSADVPGPPASPASSDGAAGGEFLGPADSAFLTAEAIRANEVVRQLTLCQSTLTKERNP